MTCEQFKPDLEGFALGSLEEGQRKRVERHVKSCRECADIARSYQLAVEQLLLAVPLYRAPRRLRDRVLASVGALPLPSPGALIRRSWGWTTVAAVFMALAFGGLIWGLVLSSQVNQLQGDNGRLSDLIRLDAKQREALDRLQFDVSEAKDEQKKLEDSLQQQSNLLVLVLSPDVVPTEMVGTQIAPEAFCSYIWSKEQVLGALSCKSLPGVAWDQIYELWVTKGGQTVVAAAFEPRADGSAHVLVNLPEVQGPVTKLFVTLEPYFTRGRTPSAKIILEPKPPESVSR